MPCCGHIPVCRFRRPSSVNDISGTATDQSFCARIETASSQKLPEISMGNVRLCGRQTESRTACVCGPVVNFKVTQCQGVVPTVVSVKASKQLGQSGLVTLRRGPLSDVMSL